MKLHTIWMIIGCGFPLLLIFFAPAFGISSNLSLFIFIGSMFGCHLLMPMHHSMHKDDKAEATKIQNHEYH